MKTGLCELIGIDLPIIQAPMGSASCPALAGAVCNAGGLGMLALSWTKPSDVRRVVRETRSLTQRPFGINLVLDWEQDERLAIYEWLIRHGSIDARHAATEALANMRQGVVQSVLYESLDSDDAELQAWATGQLREQIPPLSGTTCHARDNPESLHAMIPAQDLHHRVGIRDRGRFVTDHQQHLMRSLGEAQDAG